MKWHRDPLTSFDLHHSPSIYSWQLSGFLPCCLTILMLGAFGFPGSVLGQWITVSNPLVAGTQYHTYRIPGFAVGTDGSLLLFAEGRPNSGDPGGAGDIAMVFKRSTDKGVTWSTLAVLNELSGFDYSDPRVVIDENSGKVHLQYTQWPTNVGQAGVPVGLGNNSSVTLYQSSLDRGATWSTPANINTPVKDPSWASLNTGPGKGIQLQWQDSAPERNGRLIIPAHQRPAAYRGVALYSDDNGANWNHGNTTPGFADESEVIELTNGDLLWDGRQSSGLIRQGYLSSDGGQTWIQAPDSGLRVTPVDTGMVRFSAERSGDDRDRILYSAPLGSTLGTGNSRDNIGVYTSYDEGKTFINPVLIQSGSSAYSVIDKLRDGTIGLVYEVNHNTVRYVNFGLQQLEGSPQRAELSHYDGFGNTVVRSNGGMGWSGAWTGSGTFTANNETQFNGGSSIPFENFRFDQAAGRLDLTGQSSRRTLATPIDLNANGTTYISLLASRVLDGTANDNSQEFLDILLQDAGNTTRASFGIGSTENVFVNSLGGVVTSGNGSFDLTANYFLVAKIVSTDSAEGNFDQIFLKAFQSGVDLIPDDDLGEGWTVIGTTTQNSSALLTQLVLSGGSNAVWSVDEVRIGSSWSAVVSNIPEPAAGLVLVGVGLGVTGRRQRSARDRS